MERYKVLKKLINNFKKVIVNSNINIWWSASTHKRQDVEAKRVNKENKK
jgi:hypothetical protein